MYRVVSDADGRFLHSCNDLFRGELRSFFFFYICSHISLALKTAAYDVSDICLILS